jgi:hypothetical protein
MHTYEINSFSKDLFTSAQNSLHGLISKVLETDSPFAEKQLRELRDNDELRGQIYRTLPNLSAIVSLANDVKLMSRLQNISSLPHESFVCVNINVRIDFSMERLQSAHNLPIHQDFHYSNPYITPINSFVLWAPLKTFSEELGKITFLKDISGISGALPHIKLQRSNHAAPHWQIDSPEYEQRMGELLITEGNFMLFDMRHPHASSINIHPFFPRITLQARYSSFLQDGFLNYSQKLKQA